MGWTRLIRAAWAWDGDYDVCRSLVQRRTDLCIRSNTGWTAVMIAARCGHENILHYHQNSGGFTPVNIAAKQGLKHLPSV